MIFLYFLPSFQPYFLASLFPFLLSTLLLTLIGWLKLFPRRAAFQLRARFLAVRLKRHVSNLCRLSLAAKLNYLRAKIGYKKRKLETWHWQVNRLFKPEQNLSDTLREVEEFNYLAAEKYLPRVYPDQVTFFSAREEVSAQENLFGWKTLVTGGVEVVAVPGDHQSMIQEPHVHLLAEQLQLRLTQTSTHKQNQEL